VISLLERAFATTFEGNLKAVGPCGALNRERASARSQFRFCSVDDEAAAARALGEIKGVIRAAQQLRRILLGRNSAIPALTDDADTGDGQESLRPRSVRRSWATVSMLSCDIKFEMVDLSAIAG